MIPEKLHLMMLLTVIGINGICILILAKKIDKNVEKNSILDDKINAEIARLNNYH
jgi:hypothetical protein